MQFILQREQSTTFRVIIMKPLSVAWSTSVWSNQATFTTNHVIHYKLLQSLVHFVHLVVGIKYEYIAAWFTSLLTARNVRRLSTLQQYCSRHCFQIVEWWSRTVSVDVISGTNRLTYLLTKQPTPYSNVVLRRYEPQLLDVSLYFIKTGGSWGY